MTGDAALKNSKKEKKRLQGSPRISAIKLSPKRPWDKIK
jgi:hypothetical protein